MISQLNRFYGLNLEADEERPKAKMKSTHEIESRSKLGPETKMRSTYKVKQKLKSEPNVKIRSAHEDEQRMRLTYETGTRGLRLWSKSETEYK